MPRADDEGAATVLAILDGLPADTEHADGVRLAVLWLCAYPGKVPTRIRRYWTEHGRDLAAEDPR